VGNRPQPTASGEVWWKNQTTAIIALVATIVLSVGGSFLTAFLTVGSWVRTDVQNAHTESRSDITALRNEVIDLRTRVERLERDRQEDRKQLESWSARKFNEFCQALKGTYDYGPGLCRLPGQQVVLKYEPPFL
jgi:hypothetical protein